MSDCMIDNCHEPAASSSLCPSHYATWRNDPLVGVSAEGVERRRSEYAARLEACPLVVFLSRYQPTFSSALMSRHWALSCGFDCECQCHGR